MAPVAELVDKDVSEPLTYFDMTTTMAFAAFADAPVDAAIVEVGLGGAEDSTNVLHARIAVITPIGLDHTEWLGDTIADIAWAKAGIVHNGATLILAAQPDEALTPIYERAVQVDATVAAEGRQFGVLRRELAIGGQVLAIQGLGGVYDDVYLPLHGAHQAQNAAVALAAVEAFLGAGKSRQLDPATVRAGFADVTSPGRLERVRTAPTVLLDAAHNPPRRSPRSRRSSRSAGWSPSWRSSPTRTRPACSNCSNRSSTRLSSPATRRPGRCRSRSWPRSPSRSSGRTG